MKKILLYSGGVDSWLINQIWEPDMRVYVDLGTDYGKEEIELFKKNNEDVQVIPFDLSEYELEDKFIPLRNLYLIMLACNITDFEDVEICLGATVADRSYDKSMEFLEKTENLLNYMYTPYISQPHSKKIKIVKEFKNKSKKELLAMYLEKGGDIEKAFNESYGSFKKDMTEWECKKFYRKYVAFKLNGYSFPQYVDERMFTYFTNNELKEIKKLGEGYNRGVEGQEMLEVYKELLQVYGV